MSAGVLNLASVSSPQRKISSGPLPSMGRVREGCGAGDSAARLLSPLHKGEGAGGFCFVERRSEWLPHPRRLPEE